MQSQDRGSAQVGVLVGEMLSIPVVTTVVDFSYSDSRIEVKRELEGGPRAKVTLKTHALVTCQLGLNTPRYPTFSSIMKAKKNELLTVSVRDLNNVKAGQKTAKLYFPVKKAGATVLEGDPGDLAEQLIQILKAKTGVLA
jgi:electron transfer flavoprotein beta subunit